MRRNANPSTLREMSGADGNVLRRLYPMSRDGIPMFDEMNLTRLRYSAMDGTRNKRILLKIRNSVGNVRLRRDLYAFSIMKFMSLYENRVIEDICDDHVHRTYKRKVPKSPLSSISSTCYHDHLRNYYMNTTREHLQSGKIKLRHFVDIDPNDFH